MLVSRRVFACPALGASHETHAVVGSHFRLHVVRTRGVVLDDDLYLRRGEVPVYDRGRASRPFVVVPLAGRICLRTDARRRWLEPGEVAFVDAKARVRVRQQDDYAGLMLEWEPGAWGPALAAGVDACRLAIADASALAAGAERIIQADDPGADVVGVLARLRGLGLALERHDARGLAESIPDPMVRLSRALDHALSNLAAQPMWIDLASPAARSQRQLQRSIARFNARFGFAGQSWREVRDRRRLTIGVPMMTARGATTEQVAAALGYGSPSAFCRAFAHAGLASPGSLARAARELA